MTKVLSLVDYTERRRQRLLDRLARAEQSLREKTTFLGPRPWPAEQIDWQKVLAPARKPGRRRKGESS